MNDEGHIARSIDLKQSERGVAKLRYDCEDTELLVRTINYNAETLLDVLERLSKLENESYAASTEKAAERM